MPADPTEAEMRCEPGTCCSWCGWPSPLPSVSRLDAAGVRHWFHTVCFVRTSEFMREVVSVQRVR